MISRRHFLTTSTIAGASALALDRAPAFAQKRELTMLSFNHFVPASDDELRRQAEAFGKQAGVTVRVDTIAGPQLPAKRAAEVSSQSGHDIVVTSPIGVVGPKGMEPRVVRRLHDAFLKATSDPAYLRSMEQFDQVPEYLGSEDYARAAAREVPREKAFVQELGITLD